MTSAQPLPPVDGVADNPLTEFPMVGWLVGLLDTLLTDLGFSMWLAQAIELILLAVLLYFVLDLCLRKVIPRVVAMLVPATATLLDGALVALLLPEYAVTKAVGQRTPPAALYFYGELVVRLTDLLKSLLRRVLPPIAAVRRLPKLAVVVVLVLLFAVWNENKCSAIDPATGCVSPVSHWIAEAGKWADDTN
jgi:hypothetical protein